MKKLEELLNSLIKRGWKPWGFEGLTNCKEKISILIFYNQEGLHIRHSIRELVSIESGLRQFVCKNKLYKEDNGKIERYLDFNKDDYLFHYATDYQYRLIESALIPEEELEKFLLDNIRIEGIMN